MLGIPHARASASVDQRAPSLLGWGRHPAFFAIFSASARRLKGHRPDEHTRQQRPASSDQQRLLQRRGQEGCEPLPDPKDATIARMKDTKITLALTAMLA